MGDILVLISSKGGSGKSTVAVGLSAALSLCGKSVLLIDADEGARCLDTMLNIGENTVFDIADVINGTELKDAVLHNPGLPNVSVVPSPYRNEPLDFKKLSKLVIEWRQDYDYIIIDTKGQLPAERILDLTPLARFISVVTTDSVALKNTGVLCSTLAENGVDCNLIINRYKMKGQNKQINNIDNIIDTCSAQLLGIVPEDKNIGVYAGKPLVFGSAAKAIHRIAARINGEKMPLPKINEI